MRSSGARSGVFARAGIERADVRAKRREGPRRSLRVRASAAVDPRRAAFPDARRRDAPRARALDETHRAGKKAALKVAKRKQQPRAARIRERVVSRRASRAPYLSGLFIFVRLRVRRLVRRRLRVSRARVLLDAALAASRRGRLIGSAVVARVFGGDVRRVPRRGRHVRATARARRGAGARGLEARLERPVALSRSSRARVCGFARNAARPSASRGEKGRVFPAKADADVEKSSEWTRRTASGRTKSLQSRSASVVERRASFPTHQRLSRFVTPDDAARSWPARRVRRSRRRRR